MNKTFDWTLVRSFLAVMEHGSLLAAARALGISQPTLGRHMAALEQQIGATLFERTGRALVPTALAQRLAEQGRGLETAANAFALSAMGTQAQRGGTVRITASEPVSCVMLPPLLAQMRVTLPDIQVELVASDGVSDLLRREADVAIRMVQPRQADLIARRIGRVGISACAHRSYLLRRGTPQRPADLLAHDLVGTDRSDAVIRGFAAMGHPLPREAFAVRTDHLMAYWGLVRAGLGVGFCANYLIRSDPDVVGLLPGLKALEIPVWLVVHREIRHTPRFRRVFDFLAQALPAALN